MDSLHAVSTVTEYMQTASGKLKAGSSELELEHFPFHPPCSPSTPNHFYSLGKAMMIMASLMFLITSASCVAAQVKIDVTLLHSAVPKGAVCLDGSAPGYSYAEGFGNGSSSWIVYLQGGGWCNSTADCTSRTTQRNGSSLHFPKQTNFTGLLEFNDSYNPYFYNWHKVFIYYCDGASFLADVEHPVHNLTFRGGRIFKVMMEEMMSNGMKNAKNAILTGSSAGGLSTCLHCDNFGALFPPTTRVKCISDSGFFFHRDQTDGKPDYFGQVIATHDLVKFLPRSCTTKMDPTLCLNPENFIGDLKTPLFLLESAFDSNQISYGLIPNEEKPAWMKCLQNISLCNSTELQIMRDFRAIFIEKLLKLDHSPSRGMFVHSYYRHGHLLQRGGWMCSFVYGNTLANKTIGEVVSDWYFNGSSMKMIDVENDIPLHSMDQDTDFLNQQCLATLELKSAAYDHLQIANKILCVAAHIFITLLLY